MGALVVYAVLNVSRLAVLSGVARLAWRSLSPNCFTYRATTTYEGMYLGAPFSGKYASFKQMLQKELGKEIKLYERLGWFTLIFGAAVNYLWVYFFTFFSDDVFSYDPNRQ